MGIGPDSVTYGKRDRRFPIEALDAFIAARTVKSRSAPVEPPMVKRKPGRPRKMERGTNKHMLHWSTVLLALALGYLLWSLGFLDHLSALSTDV